VVVHLAPQPAASAMCATSCAGSAREPTSRPSGTSRRSYADACPPQQDMTNSMPRGRQPVSSSHLAGSRSGRVFPVVHVAARQLPDPAVHDEPVPPHQQDPVAGVIQDRRHRAAPHPEDVLGESHLVRKLDIGKAQIPDGAVVAIRPRRVRLPRAARRRQPTASAKSSPSSPTALPTTRLPATCTSAPAPPKPTSGTCLPSWTRVTGCTWPSSPTAPGAGAVNSRRGTS